MYTVISSTLAPDMFLVWAGHKVAEEKEHLVSEEISNLDTCECSARLLLTIGKRESVALAATRPDVLNY